MPGLRHRDRVRQGRRVTAHAHDEHAAHVAALAARLASWPEAVTEADPVAIAQLLGGRCPCRSCAFDCNWRGERRERNGSIWRVLSGAVVEGVIDTELSEIHHTLRRIRAAARAYSPGDRSPNGVVSP